MNIEKPLISDVAGLSQPLSKLMESIQSGLGVLYEPTRMVRKAKAEAKQIHIIAKACQENMNVPVRYSKEGVEISTDIPLRELACRAMLRNLTQEINKQQNLEHVIEFAKEVLEQEKEVSKEPVSQTWLSNFFEAAGHVDEENLQKIWGKLLAGEIKQPNSYSLRTLHVLKNMSTKEAELFQRLAGFIMISKSIYWMPREAELEQQYQIAYNDILTLQECGLLHVESSSVLNVELENKGACSIFNKHLCAQLTNKTDTKLKLQYPAYSLTVVGQSLFQIIHAVPNDDFFKDYITLLTQKDQRISAQIYPILHLEFKNREVFATYDETSPIY